MFEADAAANVKGYGLRKLVQADFVAYKGYQGLLEEDRAHDSNGKLGSK